MRYDILTKNGITQWNKKRESASRMRHAVRVYLSLVAPRSTRTKTIKEIESVRPRAPFAPQQTRAAAPALHNADECFVVVATFGGHRIAGRLLGATGRRGAGRGRLRRWPLRPPRSWGGRRCGLGTRWDGQAADSQQTAPDAAAGAQPDAGHPAQAAGRRRQPQRPPPEFVWGVLWENRPGHPVPRPRSVLTFFTNWNLVFANKNSGKGKGYKSIEEYKEMAKKKLLGGFLFIFCLSVKAHLI